jgi:anti-sigma factor RsiW
MTREELEFSICQYLDGTLPEGERVALEGRLATDSEAQAILRQERALTGVLRSGVGIPSVRWDELAERISGAIDEQLEERVARASSMMKMRWPSYAAAAACVGLVAGIAMHLLSQPRGQMGRSGGVAAPIAMVVEGPQEDSPGGPMVTEVSIGPGGSYTKASSLAPYADEMDSRPTRVVIAAGMPIEPEAPPASPF